MRTINPLPPQLRGRPVTAAVLKKWGIPRSRLLRSDMLPLGSGVYVPEYLAHGASVAGLDRLRAAGIAADFPDGYLCHLTAARLWECPLPARFNDQRSIHLAHPWDSGFRVRRSGVTGHRLVRLQDGATERWGLKVTSAARTWRDLSRYLSVEELVAVGDHMVRRPHPHFEGRCDPHSEVETLREAVNSVANFRGRGTAAGALEHIRVGADSAAETMLRLRMLRAGLPEPVLQVPLAPGVPLGYRADMGYPQWKIAIQYDGAVHFTADRARMDQRRDNAFVSQGWMLLRFNRTDHREGFRSAVRQVAAAVDLFRNRS